MLQYLLNTTAIWLLSLLCFDLFLKRETWHSMNRGYLLATLLLGITVPLITWPSYSSAAGYIDNIRQPLYIPVEQARQSAIQTVTVHDTPSFHWTTFVGWLYLAGASVSLLLLLREIFVLIRCYRTGKKTSDGHYTIVETFHNHGPFSFGKIIFISSRKNYDVEQWQIVLEHEKRHSQLQHLADMIIIQLVQIAFWFHPLVYLYRRRLLLVHEYQADTAASLRPLQYGHFLVEQSLLARGPLPAHSFNRSPIKNRLHMLTKNAPSKMAKAKYWLITPVLLAGLICCAKGNENNEKKKINDHTIVYRGNTFGLTDLQKTTIMTTNPKTGKEEKSEIEIPQYPIKMNGKQIRNQPEVKEMPVYAEGILEEKILDAVKPELAQLPDADNYVISIFNMVVDEKGKLVYYDIRGLERYYNMSDNIPEHSGITPELKATVAAKVSSFLDGPLQFKPAILDGKPVVCNADQRAMNFSVKNHQVTYDIR